MAKHRSYIPKVLLFSAFLTAGLCMAAVVEYPQMIEMKATDTAVDIIDKASDVRPSARQMQHHQDEFIAFIHFGPNTFTGKEWGNGMEDPNVFNPPEVDTDQWCRVVKAAGMTKVILTTKHHDGYCLWPTRYNRDFSIRQSPWKNGQGDVVRAFVDSARKYDLKVGFYLSPADLYQIESEGGLYGNRSEYRDSVIPTKAEFFQSDPLKQRAVADGLPTFKVRADDYNRYYMNQLYELLTEYGPIHEVWIDGAHPKRKGNQQYVRDEWFRMIRKLAPEAVIFGGPDARWCGNEFGGTRESEWNVLTIDNLKVCGYDRQPDEIATDRMITAKEYDVYGQSFQSHYLYYIIPEVDTSIRDGWFWRNDTEQKVKTPDEIFDIYERSVGGNSVFLLNIPPNRFGRFSSRDEQCMLEVGRRISQTYGRDLSNDASASVGNLLDHNISTYWQADSKTTALTVTLPSSRKVNRVCLQEAIADVGQRVKEHALDVWVDGHWQQVAAGTTIGYKKILRFDTVTADRFRVRILDARKAPAIASFSAHYYPDRPAVQPSRPRVIVSSDIGGTDNDDFQSMVHYLIYADCFDTEGLISSPTGDGRKANFLEVIDAYEKDYKNLSSHSESYPTPQSLRDMTKQGAVDPSPAAGYSQPTDGSKWIIQRALANDSRPLWILVWGSITDVAQAVHDNPAIKKNIRVYSIGSWNTWVDQSAQSYLYDNHPDLWWIESNTTFRGMYCGGNQSGDLGNVKFVEQHVRQHGALGDFFFAKKPDIKMGDTPSVLYLLRGNPEDPTAEHWGGRFRKTQHGDHYWTDLPDSQYRQDWTDEYKKFKQFDGAKTASQWRQECLCDWQRRMDWTLATEL